MAICSCVATHAPSNRATHAHHVWPLGMGGPDEPWNIVDICPNMHTSTHQLIRLIGYRYDGDAPWWIRRQFPLLARELAEAGWQRWHDAGRPVAQARWLYQGMRVAVPPPDTLR